MASWGGYLNIVSLLLKDIRVDPMDKDSKYYNLSYNAVSFAAHHNRYEVIKLFIDFGIDPSCDEDQPIILTAR